MASSPTERDIPSNSAPEVGSDPEMDSAIDAFLDGKPRASAWREMRELLVARRQALREELTALDSGAGQEKTVRRKIAELDTQIALVSEEEAVAQFVEDSVRASMIRPETPHDSEE
jgi:hypothetical protein